MNPSEHPEISVDPVRFGGRELRILQHSRKVDSSYSPIRVEPPHQLLRYFLPRERNTFIDVGAHVGTVTLFVAIIYKNVVAYEPFPANRILLEAAVQVNGLTNIRTESTLVSDQTGVATFYLKPGGSMVHSMLPPSGPHQKVELPVTTLDLSLRELEEPLSYIKIDVEGMECQVVHGMQEVIERQRTKPVLELEFAPNRWVKNLQRVGDFFAFLDRHNYIPYFPTKGFITPISRQTLRMILHDWKQVGYDSWTDVIFVPSELATTADWNRAFTEARACYSA